MPYLSIVPFLRSAKRLGDWKACCAARPTIVIFGFGLAIFSIGLPDQRQISASMAPCQTEGERRMLRFFPALLGLLILASSPAAAKPSNISVRTMDGVVRGKSLPSGVTAWLGIPYAAPPVRDLRWRPPQPVAQWDGERDATQFGPQCIQPLRDARANSYAGAEVTSEDCLYVNVWAKPNAGKAPVIVYIHGGAFYSGAGNFPIYDGESVARQGAVFVNLNYRVGPLGFLALPELSAESRTRTSGNYGLLDQIAALQWVKHNIARFGGDPDNVTIAGQSAGSMSVLMLQASPLAKGLFHRAMGMSGAMLAPAIPMPSHSEAERAGSALQEIWKARTLADLRALPADRLVVPRVPGGPSTGPSLDGHVIPAPIPEIFAAGRQADVPLLLGFTRDEALGGMGPVTGLTDYAAKAGARYGERAAEILARYPATTDAEARAQARLADRDATVVAAMAEWAELQSRFGKGAVYSYEFARPHTYVPGITFSDMDPATAGAYHTSEVPFWLGTLESFNTFRATRQWTAKDRQMSEAMLAALISFARTGSPSTSTLPFPRFNPATPVLLEVGSKASASRWPDAKRLELFRAPTE